MRPLVVLSAAIALGVLAAALARLGGTLTQLRALDLPATPVAAVLPDTAGDASEAHAPTAPAADVVMNDAPVDSGNEQAAASSASGDAHIMRALTQDPDFQRAAAELLQDPDPAVQAEARQLLRDLAATQSE